MEYVFLIAVIFFSSLQTICNKQFSLKKDLGVFTYTAISNLIAALFFLAFTRDFSITLPVIGFAFAFAAACFCGDFCLVLAVKHGALSRTTLISSFSLLIPTLYGIVFLKESVSSLLILGIVCLLLSIFLVNYSQSDVKISRLWIIFITFAFIGNGMCSVIQRMEQMNCDGERYSSIFMVTALVITALLSAVAALIREGRERIRNTVRQFWYGAVVHGAAVGIVNLVVIKLNMMLPASILFPVLSAGSLTVSWLISYFIYRERFSARQLIGCLLGVCAVVLLNL